MLLIAASLFLVVIVAGAPVYLKPQVDPLRRADAIFVLGGAGYERYPYAIELALEGLAPQVVMSNPSGAEDIWLTDLCRSNRYKFKISCFEPDPPTTKGEAQQLRELAATENWHSVIVVTFIPHISRARYILEKCYDDELIMSASPADISPAYWVWTYVYQTAGYIRAWLQPEC